MTARSSSARRTSGTLAAIAVRGAAALLLVACGGGGDRDFGRADTAALLSDSLASLDTGALTGDSARLDSLGADSLAGDSLGVAGPRVVLRADSVAGDVLYHGRGGCLTCHALNGAGVSGLGPSLRDTVWLHGDGSPAMIARIVREGVAQPKSVSNRMPGYAGQLDEIAIGRIAAYVFAISHESGTVADTAVVDSAFATPVDSPGTEDSANP